MKKILIASVVLNLAFVIGASYILFRKGGISYIKQNANINIRTGQMPSSSSARWQASVSHFESLPNEDGEIIFLGNSITAGCEWAELLDNPKVKNRGIGSDDTNGLLARLSEVTESNPQKIFIEIGINDLARRMNTSSIISNYQSIIEKIKTDSPETKIYLQSVLPYGNQSIVSNDSIVILNQKIKVMADSMSLTFIYLYEKYLDEEGNLNKELFYDGVHPNGKGYLIWKEVIEHYVNEP